jgi:transcriptional regulator with XRE-family HTH domain
MINHREASKRMGRNLKKLRHKKGLTQMEIALDTNLSEAYISRIETGKARITFNLLGQLCKGLKIHSSELIEF